MNLFEPGADFSDATSEAIPQERSQCGSFCVPNFCRDGLDIVTIAMEERLGVLHAQILEVSEGDLPNTALQRRCSVRALVPIAFEASSKEKPSFRFSRAQRSKRRIIGSA